MERWTGTPEGTCNVLQMFQETHAISQRKTTTTGDENNQKKKKKKKKKNPP